MNDALRDLARHADGVTPPALDLTAIIDRGDARRRRRRRGVVAGLALSVASAVAVSAALAGRTDSSAPPAVDPSPPVVTPTEPVVPPAPVRPIVYTDDYRSEFTSGPSWPFRSLQYGERTLRLGLDVLHVDVTDDGLVLEDTEGGVHLADGESVVRIGSVTVPDGQAWSDGDVVSGASGSLVAWVAAGTEDLVVYDTHLRAVAARVPVPVCADDGCYLAAVVGDHVYVQGDTADFSEWRVDASTGTAVRTDTAEHQADLRHQPRAIVTATGEVVSDELILTPRDGLLEPSRFVEDGPDDAGVFAYGGTDTLGRKLRLRLPDGYRPDAEFALFMWLDDDRFAAMAGGVRTAADKSVGWNDGSHYGDILVCDIAERRCDLAAEGPAGNRFRLVPHVDTPN